MLFFKLFALWHCNFSCNKDRVAAKATTPKSNKDKVAAKAATPKSNKYKVAAKAATPKSNKGSFTLQAVCLLPQAA